MTRLTLQLLSFLIKLLSWNKYILHFRQQPYRYIYIFFFNFQPLYFRNRIVVVNGDVNRALVQQSRAKEPTPALSLFLSQPLVPFFLSLSRSSSPGVALDGVTASAQNGCSPRRSVDTNRTRTYTHLLSRILEWRRDSLSLSLLLSRPLTLDFFLSLSLSPSCSSRNSFSLGSRYLIDIPGERSFPAGAQSVVLLNPTEIREEEQFRRGSTRAREREREEFLAPAATVTTTTTTTTTTMMMLTASTHGARLESERACLCMRVRQIRFVIVSLALRRSGRSPCDGSTSVRSSPVSFSTKGADSDRARRLHGTVRRVLATEWRRRW